jgi:hypothetical protein
LTASSRTRKTPTCATASPCFAANSATSSSPWAAAAYDCGKGIGIAATHEGDLYQYAGIETLTNPLPPIVAVNTTAGTASEVTRHCVLTNTETKVKFVIVSWRNLPSVYQRSAADDR